MKLSHKSPISLEVLRLDPFYSRLIGRLTNDDIELIEEFTTTNLVLDKDRFEYKLNRLFLDIKNKPKNWKIILELLSVINSKREV